MWQAGNQGLPTIRLLIQCCVERYLLSPGQKRKAKRQGERDKSEKSEKKNKGIDLTDWEKV